MPMLEPTYFKNQFLIAMPQQGDQMFAEALVFICEHNADGAMGLIVNKPLPMALDALTRHLGIDTKEDKYAEDYKNRVFFGGPCDSNHGFILHDGGMIWPSSIQVNERLVLTSSQDILADIAQLQGPDHFLLALGYAGWEAGQLEREMLNNIWINVPYDFDTLFFSSPQERWRSAAKSLGIDIQLLSAQAGVD